MEAQAPHAEKRKRTVESRAISVTKTLKQLMDSQWSPNGQRSIQRLASKAVASAVRSLPEKEASARQAREMLTCAVLAEVHLGPDWASHPMDHLEEFLSHQEACAAMMASEVLHSAGPFTQWHLFEKACVLANGREVDFAIVQDLLVPEMAWGLTAMQLIDDHTAVDDDVLLYVAGVAYAAGWAALPHPLEGATHYLVRQMKDKTLARSIEEGNFPGEEGKIQKGRIDAAHAYVDHRLHKLHDELMGLCPIV